jgi:hypothetical protein
VLPRGLRAPIDLSFHTFLLHPLGRDYRADALGMRPKDTPFYDSRLAGEQKRSGVVSAIDVRRKMQNKVSGLEKTARAGGFGGLLSRRELGAAKVESEFAREMMMFPLSIKNPEVPMASGRAAPRKKVTIPQAKDQTRHLTGPERFIRYVVCSM